ncbi:MAG: pilus assembly protein [Pseudomonadota bacterium]
MKRTLLRPFLPCLLLALGACSTTTPRLDQQFGAALNTVKAQQWLHPDAARNTNPVAGMDGQAAKSAYDNYQKSYRAPPPPTGSFTIGLVR